MSLLDDLLRVAKATVLSRVEAWLVWLRSGWIEDAPLPSDAVPLRALRVALDAVDELRTLLEVVAESPPIAGGRVDGGWVDLLREGGRGGRDELVPVFDIGLDLWDECESLRSELVVVVDRVLRLAPNLDERGESLLERLEAGGVLDPTESVDVTAPSVLPFISDWKGS